MTDSEKKYREELEQYRKIIDLTIKQQEKKGLKPYSHPDHYDRMCEKEDRNS